MHPITRLSLIAGLLLAMGAAALLLQSWAETPLASGEGLSRPLRLDEMTQMSPSLVAIPPPSLSALQAPQTLPDARLRELRRREQIAAASLTLLALAAITAAALLPRAQPRPSLDNSARQGVELLARAAATQSEALAHERDVRHRVEENLAMEQMRAGQAVADKVRLGRDLHDGMIQSLYATGLLLTAARQHLAAEPARATAQLDRGVELLNATIREMREAIGSLSAARQEEQSFPAAVGLVLEMLGSGRTATFDLRLEDKAAAQVGAMQCADLLQIIREAVSNALRHGAARTVTVRLHEDQGRLCLLVQDDGAGFDPAKISAPGHGLGNLRARADLLHGELLVTSQPGAGTRVVLIFPSAVATLPHPAPSQA